MSIDTDSMPFFAPIDALSSAISQALERISIGIHSRDHVMRILTNALKSMEELDFSFSCSVTKQSIIAVVKQICDKIENKWEVVLFTVRHLLLDDGTKTNRRLIDLIGLTADVELCFTQSKLLCDEIQHLIFIAQFAELSVPNSVALRFAKDDASPMILLTLATGIVQDDCNEYRKVKYCFMHVTPLHRICKLFQVQKDSDEKNSGILKIACKSQVHSTRHHYLKVGFRIIAFAPIVVCAIEQDCNGVSRQEIDHLKSWARQEKIYSDIMKAYHHNRFSSLETQNKLAVNEASDDHAIGINVNLNCCNSIENQENGTHTITIMILTTSYPD